LNIIKDEKWEEKLELITQTLFFLKANQYLFHEFEKVVGANIILKNDKYFIGWIRQNYFIAAAMGVRRQIDEHSDCISLIKVLGRIKENPTLLSRDRYYSLSTITDVYGDSSGAIDAAFDALVGKGRDFIDPIDVEKDIASLKTATDTIKNHADKTIAHFDKKTVSHEYPLDKKALDDAIEVFEKILDKYYELLNGTGMGFNPIPPVPWKNIFTVPWIPNK